MNPRQCRAARALLGLSQVQLCNLAGISHKPLVDFEKGKTHPYPSTIEKLRQVLEAEGVEFIPSNGGGAGVRLKEPEA